MRPAMFALGEICSGSQVDFPAPVGALSKTCGACCRADNKFRKDSGNRQ
jgi:hypothetical protein